MGQKKSFTLSTESILNTNRDSSVGAKDKEKTKGSPSAGRPRINGSRPTSTSQQGLREGQTRMTFIVSQEKQDKLKYISYFERLSIREILDEAIEDYINKYEAQAGPIELN